MYTYGRKTGCRISLDYTYRGMRIAYLENEAIRVGVLLDKGADIFEFTYKPRDLDFMWQSPIEMRKPFVATSALPEGAFHDYYYGGWQEVLPSAGWATEPYLGTYQGLHGEASLLPFEATFVEDTPDSVSLRTRVRLYRSPLTLERTMSLERDKAALFIKERLVNESEAEFAIMWGHHPALGTPFLNENCVVQVPAKKVEVLAFHPNGLWEPGGDYDFPMVPNRRTGKLQDITKVLPKDTRSVDVVFFKELDRRLVCDHRTKNRASALEWPGTSPCSSIFGCGRYTAATTIIRGTDEPTIAPWSLSPAIPQPESRTRSRMEQPCS